MMLAGFEAPSSGEILLNGQSLAGRPPYKRSMGVVFQNYALFPHMSVAKNLAFPLGVRGIKGVEAKTKVEAAQIGRATSELQSLMRISYAVFCLKKKKNQTNK